MRNFRIVWQANRPILIENININPLYKNQSAKNYNSNIDCHTFDCKLTLREEISKDLTLLIGKSISTVQIITWKEPKSNRGDQIFREDFEIEHRDQIRGEPDDM